ncbi:DUF2855 family protein [Rivibacter subsaxonicus]|uniref:Uncharacterized protein DUF2855 n=1 Tax=Rivibacter subsaxonicus TaxID=457575 RepID=A0A4Q7VWL1_9BURK|nr:DUF2855 family protein [Rivibacter subsaxonicus]RZU01117.1 uncharacterized protein DUF2855 [Rivibacter subsaxonicus]
MSAQSFIVRRGQLHEARFIDDEAASVALRPGQVRLRIDAFALTSNNITYAAFGETMRYWDFFPCAVPDHGRIPVWGFADVVESGVEGVAVGERFYGYFPVSRFVVLEPEKVGASGFSDGAPHRRELHAVYNRYARCSADPGYRPELEAEIALLRPLFTTSFLIDDFLADNDFFGASTVLLSSASSKTAYGTAFCLSQRRGTPGAPRIVGLTSAANRAFTAGLGCYDEVVDYDAITSLPAGTPTVYVDMSGSAPVRSQVHAHFDQQLRYSCSVGGTHWDELGGGKGLAGPRPVLFFAPAQIKKRHGDWGPAELGRRIEAAWLAFLKPATDSASPWLTVERGAGPGAVEQVYRELLGGGTRPQTGHVLSL